MIAFSAICPNNPIFLPQISHKNKGATQKTKNAMDKIGKLLKNNCIETLIIFSNHQHSLKKSFTINSSKKFLIDFKEFGDLETQLNFQGNLALSHQIKESVESQLPVQLISEENLDYTCGVPLYFFNKLNPKIKIINIGCCELSNEKHFELGKKIIDILQNSYEKIGLLASNNFFNYQSRINQIKLSELLKNQNTKKILEICNSEENLHIKPALILLGTIIQLDYSAEKISSQKISNQNYLTYNFNLK